MTRRGVREDEEAVALADHQALLASSPQLQIPAVTDEPSLRSAIRYADSHPRARIFVVKHAARLGLAHLLPEWPETTETVVNVGRVSARLTDDRRLREAPAYPLRPGAAQAIYEAAYGRPAPPPPTEAQRRHLVVAEPVLDPPVRDPRAGNGGFR